MLIIAGVHGDEFEPVAAAIRLHGSLSRMKVLKGSIEIIPIVNFSAFEYSTRCGSDGLDLARICPGEENGSPSMQAAWDVSERIRQADYLIDMHTGGSLFDIFPLAGYMLHANAEVLRAQRIMAEAFGMKLIWGTDNSLEGRTLSVARDQNIPAIYVEFRGGNGVNISVVDAYCEGCLRVLSAMGFITHHSHAAPPVYRVEDEKKSSGYLQQMLPSPADGLFVCYRTPGTVVEKNEQIGEIINPVSLHTSAVFAERSGLFFFKRISASVKTGDSLGGIIELNG